MTKRLTLTVQEMHDHIVQLCGAFKIKLIEDPTAQYEQGVSLNILDPRNFTAAAQAIIVRPVTDDASYCVALHEIGHCAHPLGHSPHVTVLTREKAAWEWARHHALCWTNAMEQCAQYSERDYEKRDAAEREKLALQQQQAVVDRAARKQFLKRLIKL